MRIPVAGPYRPWARLYLFPDGRLVWLVRLWQVDRPVARVVRPEILRAYARRSGLPSVVTELDRLVERGRAASQHALD